MHVCLSEQHIGQYWQLLKNMMIVEAEKLNGNCTTWQVHENVVLVEGGGMAVAIQVAKGICFNVDADVWIFLSHRCEKYTGNCHRECTPSHHEHCSH
jgi:hypothetical protein